MTWHRPLFILLLSLSLSGCSSYRLGFQPGELVPHTIVIPFAEGDKDGHFSLALVEEVARRTPFIYHPTCGERLLKVTLIEHKVKNVGFQYERKRSGKIRNYIVPSETRLTAWAEVQYIDLVSGAEYPSKTIGASVEFDHEYYSSRNGVNIFSLGQLTDYDAALDAAWKPLSKKLAREIADYLMAITYGE